MSHDFLGDARAATLPRARQCRVASDATRLNKGVQNVLGQAFGAVGGRLPFPAALVWASNQTLPQTPWGHSAGGSWGQ